MKKCQTYPGIISIAQQFLSDNEESILVEYPVLMTHIDQFLLQAATRQLKMGTSAFPKGFISKAWFTVQEEWCRMNTYKFDIDRWACTFIKSIQAFTQAMWTK